MKFEDWLNPSTFLIVGVVVVAFLLMIIFFRFSRAPKKEKARREESEATSAQVNSFLREHQIGRPDDDFVVKHETADDENVSEEEIKRAADASLRKITDSSRRFS